MAIITISRGSYSRGKEVAEALADRLGYECVSRDILLETCEEFAIPEIRLIKALHDAPSVLDRFSHGRERYISYFRAAFLNHMVKDNIVYHGLSGHFFLQGIAHAAKVRIIGKMEDRIKEEMKRENSSAEEARYLLKKDDDERRKWAMSLYGMDTSNSNLYDLVLRIDIMTINDVVGILEKITKKGRFDATPESTKIIKKQALLANIHAQIVSHSPRATVSINDGVVTLANLDSALKYDEDFRKKTTKKLIETYNVKDVVYAKSVKAKKDHINPFYNLS
jgi:cytidylate kinase